MADIKTQKHDAIVLSSQSEKELQRKFVELFKGAPLPDDEILPNLGLFLSSKSLSRVLFFYEIYKKIIHTHGIIVEFGVRWGQTLSLLAALRGIFEPFNRHRKIIGFDTFAGFKGMSDKDGTMCRTVDGSFSVSDNYQQYLEELLSLQEALNPISHLKKFELVRGDATDTVPAYLKRQPYVDPQRLGVAGCSFGGIQTLLAAERGAGYRAAVAISPGAQSWSGNVPLRERLVAAARKAEIPVFLIQPPKDGSLEPSRVVGVHQ